jgi:hypothetical protein
MRNLGRRNRRVGDTGGEKNSGCYIIGRVVPHSVRRLSKIAFVLNRETK